MSHFGLIALWVTGLVLAVALSAILIAVVYIHYVHLKYRHIPGPPRTSFFLGNIPELKLYHDQGKIHGDAVLDWSKEYGPVFVVHIFWYTFIFLLSPEAVKEILVTSNYPKSKFVYNNLASIWGVRFMGNGLVTELDNSKWERTRNLFNPAFHRSYLKTCIEQFNASSNTLVSQLKRKADGKTPVTMLEELNKVAIDIIGKVAFGADLEIYEEGDDCPFTKAVTAAMHGITYAEENPWDRFNPSKRARAKRRSLRESVQFIRDAGRRCIQKQLDLIRTGQPLTHNVLAHILQAACAESDGLPDMEEMIDQFVTFFIAGQETTANLLSWTIMELTHNPQIAYRLRNEVNAVLGDRADIPFEDLHKLEYMMAVLKESLRLHPPATGAVREAPKDCVFSDIKIPKGSIMVLLTYTMSRMEQYFKDPLTYDPDRFLHEEDRAMYAYYPFSVGQRNCIGQQFALIEARVVLAKLIQHFTFDWVPGQSMGVIEELTTKPKDGCKCYVKLAT